MFEYKKMDSAGCKSVFTKSSVQQPASVQTPAGIAKSSFVKSKVQQGTSGTQSFIHMGSRRTYKYNGR